MASASPPTAACGRLLPWWWRPDTAICRSFLPPAAGCRRRSFRSWPADYRRPEQLPAGGVLIVGASSTGVQLADEIQRSGRQVTLAVGRHTRLPRRYRGRDILWWLDRLGVLTQGADAVHGYRAFAAPALPPVGGQARSLIARSGGAARSRASGWWAGSATSAAIASVLPTISSPRPPRRTSRWPRSSTRIDRFIATTGVAAAPREPFTPTWPLAADAPDTPRSEGRAHRDGDLGNRLSARVSVAACAGSRCSGEISAQRRDHAGEPGSTCSA